MAIIGNIIKGVINLRNSISSETDHVENQRETLKLLLDTAKDTEFGKHYKFSEILNSVDPYKEFKSTIPYFSYDKINSEWWYKLHEGKDNVTWPGHPDYFALSSGTTGKTSKRIPVTDDMIEAIKNAGIKQILAIENFDLPADFFEKEIMMLGSSTNLEK